MRTDLKIVHYINQFYGQYGGEDTAGMKIAITEKAVGPGILLENLLKGRGRVIRTIICGDNYASENMDTVVPKLLEKVREAKADIFIAGPAFNAGRYGIVCGALTTAVQKTLKIPSVTGLYVENPGVDLYSHEAYIMETANHGKNMSEAMEKMVRFALRLADGDTIGSGRIEGFHGTGPVADIAYEIPAAKRMVDMLLKKYYHQPYTTEVPIPNQQPVVPSQLKKAINHAKIALVTDGGLVPVGNPDRMAPVNSVKFSTYSLKGKNTLESADYDVSHQGYDNSYVRENPNRLVPVDVMRKLEKEGSIGELDNQFYTTAGVMTSQENARKFGSDIAKILKERMVDAVILTST